jgi:hypothetical protein
MWLSTHWQISHWWKANTMGDVLVQIIFGWPAIIMSILLSIAGVSLNKPTFLVAAGFVSIPFAAYLTAASSYPGLLLPFFHFGSAYAVKRQKALFAWLLIVPMMIVSVMLAYVVLTQ